MPLLAALLNASYLWIVGFASNVMWYVHTIAWARRAFIVSVGVAFFAAIAACMSALLSMVSGAGLPSRFVMGLGMFIPSNAVAVMACLGSVYLACIVYRLKLNALQW